MFLTPKVFNFNVYQSLEWPDLVLPPFPRKQASMNKTVAKIRPPLHDLHPPHRINVRHLPSIPLSKVSALHGASIATNRFHANNLLLQSLTTPGQNIPQPSKKNANRPTKNVFDPIQSKPRPITIIKQGNEKPRKTITILLNRRTMQTLDQLLADISEAFGYQKHRSDKIKRLYTLKGRQVNGIHDFFREDDIFVASINNHEISSADLQDINHEMFAEPSSRGNGLKQIFQSPVTDRDTPLANTAPMSVDVKKMVHIRDGELLEDDDELAGKDSELAGSQKAAVRPSILKPIESLPEDSASSTDLLSRKLKNLKSVKSNATQTIEQQRERERQRLRDEDERRRKMFSRKDPLQAGTITTTPRFEQLAIDLSIPDASPSSKPKTSLTATNKLSLTRLSIAHQPDETPAVVLKKLTIKKRSSIIHPSPAVVTDRYEFGKKMGDGNFAIVRRSKSRTVDREYAIKIIDKSKMKGKEFMLDHEINIMYMCNHVNIIRLFEDYETAEEIYLVMELVKGGDLFDHISRHRRFDEQAAALMIKDVAEALLYLHAKNIVHRDLKPENLLVVQRKDGRINIKLTDFGLAIVVTDTIKTVCGTPTYVAPEILAETGYGIEVDCWATGIILYILLCGYPPFKATDRNQEELFQLIQQGKFSYDAEYWNSISTNVKNLIDHLLVTDRHKRLRAQEILLHPWIMAMGQTKTLRYTEELKTSLRSKYDAKILEYAAEGGAS